MSTKKEATYFLSLLGQENEKKNYYPCLIIHIIYHDFRESASNYNFKQYKYVILNVPGFKTLGS